ncbi:HAUS augmin-like complex subunit 5 [Phyllobates terribilis]|uniref:HAUS augmin-like complex subunit 5 n=1 Tax=Phyllobates terribilis TaxID=111132 RepID=UPI003CCB4C17
MDRRSLAQDVRRWAVQEMGLPPHKAPSEEMLQRLFIGQCADIWKYVIRHVRSERTVRNMEGNLHWYQQLQHSEAQRSAEEKELQRRKQLSQEILQLRSELQHLQEQIQSAEKDVSRQELSNHKSQDLNQRLLLLRAFARRKEMESDDLREENLNVQDSCVRLIDISRASQWDVVFPPLEEDSAMNTFPEPQVLRDVREACQTRFNYLRSLYDDISGSMPTGREDLRSFANRQWMSQTEKIWSLYPPNHVVSCLKHLAEESSRDMRRLQTSGAEDPAETSRSFSETPTDLHETTENLEPTRPKRALSQDARREALAVLPSYSALLQDGWKESVSVGSELRNVQKRLKDLSSRMAEKIQEVHRALSDGSELSALSREAFDAELRLVRLRGCQTALQQECRALQSEVAEKKQEVKLLQKQQQNIQSVCHLLDRKQKQIQVLAQGAVICRSQVRQQRLEVQRFVQEKLRPRPHEIFQETQRLQDGIQKDLKHFSSVSLPAMQKVHTDGATAVPAQELSINRVSDPRSPHYAAYSGIYTSVGLSLYKAPETVLPHVAEMKRRLHFLRSQQSSRRRAATRLQWQLCESPSAGIDTLLQLLSSHYAQQTEQLVPQLQQLIQQCESSQEYGKAVQAAVSDWWEQPAQLCLPQEERGGQTLRQWRDRWTVAVTALQRTTGDHS